MRVLIVDDEPLARERLRSMLSDEPAVVILGECSSGPEAIAAIRQHRPDVVFLDLQMPGCDGLAVLAQFPSGQRPEVVFVTAHERYAVEAFRIHAADYVVKPFDRERLHTALNRATARIEARRTGDLEAQLEDFLATSTAPDRKSNRIAIKFKGRVVFLAPTEILRVEAANNHVVLRLASGERLKIRESLAAMEQRLGVDRFARVNRSTLIPLDQIKELKTTANEDYVVILRNGSRVPLSRHLRGPLEKFVGA